MFEGARGWVLELSSGGVGSGLWKEGRVAWSRLRISGLFGCRGGWRGGLLERGCRSRALWYGSGGMVWWRRCIEGGDVVKGSAVGRKREVVYVEGGGGEGEEWCRDRVHIQKLKDGAAGLKRITGTWLRNRPKDARVWVSRCG